MHRNICTLVSSYVASRTIQSPIKYNLQDEKCGKNGIHKVLFTQNKNAYKFLMF